MTTIVGVAETMSIVFRCVFWHIYKRIIYLQKKATGEDAVLSLQDLKEGTKLWDTYYNLVCCSGTLWRLFHEWNSACEVDLATTIKLFCKNAPIIRNAQVDVQNCILAVAQQNLFESQRQLEQQIYVDYQGHKRRKSDGTLLENEMPD